MGTRRFCACVLLLAGVLCGSSVLAQSSPKYGLGRAPTAEEMRAWDISIGPDGAELPQGRGSAKEGALLFQNKGCAGCHGKTGTGGAAPELKAKPATGLPLRMTSVTTATTEVVISEKSMLEFFRSDFSGIAVSRISTMRMSLPTPPSGWSHEGKPVGEDSNLRYVRLLDHSLPLGNVGLHIGRERRRRIALRHDAELQ